MTPYEFAIAAAIPKPTLYSEYAERYWHVTDADPRVARGCDHNTRCGCSVCEWPPRLRAVMGNGFCAGCRHVVDDHEGGKCPAAA